MALTCHETFDVDSHHLRDLLEREKDIAMVTKCSIIIDDRCLIMIEDQSALISLLVHQYRRLSYVLESLLRKRILEARNDLDRTIDRLWAKYISRFLWTILKTPNERWLVTKTSNKEHLSSMLVHYNLLDESLLVNELSLTRLSHSYKFHSTFRRLFSEIKYFVRKSVRRRANWCWARQKVVDVVLSIMSGMVFEAWNEWFNHRVSILYIFLFFFCARNYVMTKLLVILNNIAIVVL